jgi:hypothetical protein
VAVSIPRSVALRIASRSKRMPFTTSARRVEPQRDGPAVVERRTLLLQIAVIRERRPGEGEDRDDVAGDPRRTAAHSSARQGSSSAA